MKVKVRKKPVHKAERANEIRLSNETNALFSRRVRNILKRLPKTIVIDDCSDLQ